MGARSGRYSVEQVLLQPHDEGSVLGCTRGGDGGVPEVLVFADAVQV